MQNDHSHVYYVLDGELKAEYEASATVAENLR
jgi:hypothetical protein